jgi:hypothetical protein
MTITTVLILSLAAAYWLLRSRRDSDSDSDSERKPKTAQSAPSTRSPWLATSIRTRGCGCAAVKAVGNKRFLSSISVPKLPLADCASTTCNCSYVRHEDRRTTEGDRRAPFSMQTDLYHLARESERRVKKGRRDSDWSDSAASDLDYTDFEWTT